MSTRPTRIDLNSDLGEHYGQWRMGDDETMLSVVTSANVACGFHAGDPRSLLATLKAAAARGVTVGAHVAYPDLVGFGRRPMHVSDDELIADTIYQIGALQSLATAAGTEVRYVKPHGALYNTIARDSRQAAAVITGIQQVNPDLPLVCLAGSQLIDQARASGLTAVPEAFADRAYNPDGSLVARSEEGATLHDPAAVAARMLRLVQEGVVADRYGNDVAFEAASICVHGDSAGAVDMAVALRDHLLAADVTLGSFLDSDV